jgi:hypothetical protein
MDATLARRHCGPLRGSTEFGEVDDRTVLISGGRLRRKLPVVAEPTGSPYEEVVQLRKELDVSAQHVADLQQALVASRRIGIALGIVMERHKLTVDGAFEVLKSLSQERNEKLRDVAERISETGELPQP